MRTARIINQTIMSKNKLKFSALITSAKKERDIENQTDYIDVAFDILDGKKVVESRRLAFPLEFTQKQIKAEVKKSCDLYAVEKETEDERRKQDQINTEANENIAALVGKKV